MNVYLAVCGENAGDGFAQFLGTFSTYEGAEALITKYENEPLHDKREGEPVKLSEHGVRYAMSLDFVGINQAWCWRNLKDYTKSYYILEVKIDPSL